MTLNARRRFFFRSLRVAISFAIRPIPPEQSYI
jgi:hypothetical protein